MAISRKTILLICGLSFFAWVIFLGGLGSPLKPNFDEFHYIPAAKALMALAKNQNWEHPPLGKYIIGIGISLFGDEPIGWRFMSTIAGAVTLAGMGSMAFLWFGRTTAVVWIMLVTLFNHFLFVQSRIAMLDTFMFACMIWALVFFCVKRTWSLYVAGVMLGFALAFKWFAVMLVFPFLTVQFGSYLFKWDPARKKIPLLHALLSLIVIPAAVYFSTFLPLLLLKGENYHFFDLFRMQKMIYDGQKRVVSPHPYMSTWLQWLFPTRPIWYAFDKEGPNGNVVRGVFLLGNPFVMWMGLIGIFQCIWDGIRTKNSACRWIVSLFFIFWLSWAVIPRKILFYYYYYPAAMVLSFSAAWFFFRFKLERLKWVYLGACIFLFVYFYPVLSGLPFPTELFRQWMWLDSWI